MVHLTSILAITTLLATTVFAVEDVVDLGYSKYAGTTIDNGITQWFGMRYAAPPLGELRFMPPEDPPETREIQSATEPRKACLGINKEPGDERYDEDCLFINVMAPTDATRHSKLPVYFFIQGGGFGENSGPNVNGSGVIMAADHDLVFVSLHYRVGPYGFLNDGDNLTPNSGLRDQRKALEWVQEHISKFGGDPEHVVIGGASAGGASVVFHLLAEGGTDQGLFKGAIASSPSFATVLTTEQSQYQYNQFATRLGCAVSDSLSCLQNLTADEIQAKNFNIPLPGGANPPTYQWQPVLDYDFVTDYPYRSLEEGNFVRVPTIWGDDTNGGTYFAPRNASSLADSNQYLVNQYPTLTPAQLGHLNEMYPNPNASACPSPGCYWRQASNMYQEVRFMCPALYATSVYATSDDRHSIKSYHYLWNVEDPAQIAEGLGVPHTIDFEALLGWEYTEKEPESYRPGGVNERVTPVIQGYWTSFMRTLDPNEHRAHGTAQWAPWSGSWDEDRRRRRRYRRADGDGGGHSDARLVFGTGGTTEMVRLDGELRERCDWWIEHGVEMLL